MYIGETLRMLNKRAKIMFQSLDTQFTLFTKIKINLRMGLFNVLRRLPISEWVFLMYYVDFQSSCI
jgi:hypothetical protein